MKKFISILISAIMLVSCFSTVALAEDAIFGFGDAQISDTEVSIPVYASAVPSGLSNLSAVSLWYSYDKEYLTYKATEDGTLTGLSGYSNDGVVLWFDNTADGSKSISGDNLGKDNPLFTVVFTVNAVPGEGIWVKISNSKISDTEGVIAKSPDAYKVIEGYVSFGSGSEDGDITTPDGDGTTTPDGDGTTTPGGDSTTTPDGDGTTTPGDNNNNNDNTQSGNISSNNSGGRDDRPSSSPVIIAPAPSAPTKASQVFSDVSDTHWAADYALMLHQKGIVSGDSNGKANLENKITREETAKLALLVNDIVPGGTNVKASDSASVSAWAVPYMATAVEKGIFSGYSDGSVKPKANITRQEMVTVIIKALGIEVEEQVFLEFTDNKVITWSAPYIAKAVELGFVGGYEDGSFKPTKDITRAEAFKIFAKVLEYKQK